MIPPTYMLMDRRDDTAPVATDTARRPSQARPPELSARLLRVDADIWIALGVLAAVSAYAAGVQLMG